MDFWDRFFDRYSTRSKRQRRKPRRRGKGMGGEPVVPPPKGPQPGLVGGAAVAIDDDLPDR
jgi:hypothetical protein